MQSDLSTHTPFSSGLDGQRDPSAVATTKGMNSGVSREIRNFLADIEHLIEQTTSITGEDLARVKAKISDRVTAAKASIDQMSGTVTERVRTSAVATNSYVHHRPWNAIGIGAAVGVLLGFLLSRCT